MTKYMHDLRLEHYALLDMLERFGPLGSDEIRSRGINSSYGKDKLLKDLRKWGYIETKQDTKPAPTGGVRFLPSVNHITDKGVEALMSPPNEQKG